MGKILRNVAIGLACLASPAAADLASFEFAFTETCLQDLPEFRNVPDILAGKGWQGFPGADPGEFEFYRDTTAVFLRTTDIGNSPGCTVMDEVISKLEAEWLLELALAKHFPNRWGKARGSDGGPVWRLFLGDTTTFFHINDGPNDGAAISFEVRN